MDSYSIIIKPHVTEKTMNLIDMNNEIAFVVNRKANKNQIKRAFVGDKDIILDFSL